MTHEKDDGGPAFPRTTASGSVAHEGMTLRDWFAGQALMGEIATIGNETLSVAKGEDVEAALARDAKRRSEWCYRQADAMLAARKA